MVKVYTSSPSTIFMTKQADSAEKNFVQGGLAVLVGVLTYMRIPPNFFNNLSDEIFGIAQIGAILLIVGGGGLIYVGFGKREKK
jgi:hypothetical protein